MAIADCCTSRSQTVILLRLQKLVGFVDVWGRLIAPLKSMREQPKKLLNVAIAFLRVCGVIFVELPPIPERRLDCQRG